MLWRVPVFAFLSGLLSKGELNAARSLRLGRYVLAPLLLLSSAFWCNPVDSDNNWGLWFLAALFLWRLFIQPLRCLPPWMILATGVLISSCCIYAFDRSPNLYIGASWDTWEDPLSIKLALSFFAFFALGFVAEIRAPQLAAFDNRAVRLLAAAALLGLTALFASPRVVARLDAYTADLYSFDVAWRSVPPARFHAFGRSTELLWLPRLLKVLLGGLA